MANDYCVFILTHGRPNNVLTYKTLLECGFSGDIYFVIDNEDSTADQYAKNFGSDRVKMFDKKRMADSLDEANNFDDRKVIVHARNYCFELAKELGYEYFIEFDDDYDEFTYMFSDVNHSLPKDICKIFETMFRFYRRINAYTICFAQEGDFLGGFDNGNGTYRFSKRKCMNSFFCSTKREFRFIGSINEDVNTYTTLAGRGALFLTIPVFALNQQQTQAQKKGMSDIYKTRGTYIKSFTTVLMQPANVRAQVMRSKHPRIHHSIKWANTTPMIIREENKKF